MPIELQARVSKVIVYRYCGHELRIPLTHALFSSAGVDSGTNQLLTLLARDTPVPSFDRVVDIGSGTGTLGIALAKRYGATLSALDRDMMAVKWTEAVAAAHQVPCESSHAIATETVSPRPRSLVVSNLPAKAGEPVLDGMIDGIARLASLENCFASVVVVQPLAQWLLGKLSSMSATIFSESRSANHHSVVFRAPGGRLEDMEGQELPNRFIRLRSVRFVGPTSDYSIDTAYNLPEFDQLSFRLALAFDLLRSVGVSGKVLVRGVRQGHLMVGVSQRSSGRTTFTMADRDLLALLVSEHNLCGQVTLAPSIATSTISTTPDTDAYDWIVIDEDPEPGTPWDSELVATVERLLVSGGKLLIVARSTTVTRVAKKAGPLLKSLSERRMRGFRAELFVRKR
ncbi:MAG: methyltransferase [Spirochaetales bacterium]